MPSCVRGLPWLTVSAKSKECPWFLITKECVDVIFHAAKDVGTFAYSSNILCDCIRVRMQSELGQHAGFGLFVECGECGVYAV